MAKSALRKVMFWARSRPRVIKQVFADRAPSNDIAPSRAEPVDELAAITRAESFPGWLNVPASLFTLHLLDRLPVGPVVEIGVFRGKYLSILRSGVGATCRIVGYDIFTEAQAPLIEQEFTQAFGQLGNVLLIQVDSTRLTPDRVRKDCGGAPVFMSVDGSHEAGPVLSDMKLADAVIDPGGIVAMDDVLNPVALGVNEAVARFLCDENAQLVPFAYVANKMFFCRPAQHASYLQQTQDILAARGTDPSFQFYVDNKAQGNDMRRRFFGRDVLIVTG